MIFTLNADPRNTVKKSDLTTLRASGMIPAIVYGAGMEATKLSINNAEFLKCYKKSFNELAFYEIVLNGTKYHTILKDKLIHPVTRNILHIDFMVVEESAQMEFEVPIQFVGEAVGTKEGGFVDVIQRSVKITCRAKDIPEEISLDISALKVGDALHIKDLPAGNWQYKDHSDITLVVVHAKKTEEAPAAAEAPAAEAPEAEEPKAE